MKPIKIISFIVVALALTAVLFRALVVKIEPGQSGVLVKEWGGGLQKQDYSQGYYLDFGPLHTWKVMDSTVQTLNMLSTSGRKMSNRGSGQKEIFDALRVKSKEGADVTMDITIKYRITPGKAHEIFHEFGEGNQYQRQVRSRSNKTLQLNLGKLSTEQFFDPTVRKQKQDSMQKELGKILAEMHVTLVAILIRDLQFQAKFEEKIKAKTLTKQKAELEIAKTRAATESGKTMEIRAESTAKVTVIQQNLEKTIIEMRAENDKQIQKITADYQKYVTETTSEAELYMQQKQAEGIKLLKDSEARGQALRRAALSSGGGSTLVALRAVENLKLGDIMLSTQAVNPLDFDAMMERLGARK